MIYEKWAALVLSKKHPGTEKHPGTVFMRDCHVARWCRLRAAPECSNRRIVLDVDFAMPCDHVADPTPAEAE